MNAEVAIVIPAVGPEEAETWIENLHNYKRILRHFERYLYTDAKIDGRKMIKVRNMDAAYPDLNLLRNTALSIEVPSSPTVVSSGVGLPGSHYFRSGFAALSLDHAALVSKADHLLLVDSLWPRFDIEQTLITMKASGRGWRHEPHPERKGDGIILIDCTVDAVRLAITLSTEWYSNGKVISMRTNQLAAVIAKALGAIHSDLSPLDISRMQSTFSNARKTMLG